LIASLCATIEIDRAPLLGVLLICPRFKYKYLDSGVYADLTAVVETVYAASDDDDEFPDVPSHGGYSYDIDCQVLVKGGHQPTLTSLFGRLKHVMLLVHDRR
jgi:hypothetical protein